MGRGRREFWQQMDELVEMLDGLDPCRQRKVKAWYNGLMNDATSTDSVDRSAFSVVTLGDSRDELQYWLTRTPQERLHHIERLRQINYGHRASERLQRVLAVVELASS
jgi:hypothetical protein